MHISKAGNPSGDLPENKMLCSVPLGQNTCEIMKGSQAERLISAACLSVEAGLGEAYLVLATDFNGLFS